MADASTLLHFCDKRPYPILDYRALWSLGYTEKPHYTMKFWLKYLAYVRELAEHLTQDIRTIDRALWQVLERATAVKQKRGLRALYRSRFLGHTFTLRGMA